MATTTTNKLYMRFVTTQGKDRIFSFNYLDEDLTQSQVRTIANAFITNKIAFKDDYQPASISAIWWESVTKEYIIQ